MFFSSLGIKQQQNNCTNALFVSYLKISGCKRKYNLTGSIKSPTFHLFLNNVSKTLMAKIQLFLVLTLYSSGEQEPDGEDADI